MSTRTPPSPDLELPIVVMEVWYLKPELADQALVLMQEMDRLLDSSTHAHPGWCGHASFYQRSETPFEVTIVYLWRNRELHEDLIARERRLLEVFHEQYCYCQREIHYYTQLDVH